jgi:hypothetical protein
MERSELVVAGGMPGKNGITRKTQQNVLPFKQENLIM